MADQFGGVAQAGSYMMQAGLNAMNKRREMDMDREIAMARIAAANARSSDGGGGGGRDPLSKGANTFMALSGMLDQYSNKQIELGSKLTQLQSMQGPMSPDQQVEAARIQSSMRNNEYALKLLTSQFGDGNFEVTKGTPDGGQIKATFKSAAAYEAWNNTFNNSGRPEEAAQETNESLLTKIFGGQRTGQGQQGSPGQPPQGQAPMPEQDELGPVRKPKMDMPEGFEESEAEQVETSSETELLRKELARKMAQREAEAKNRSFRPNVVVGAPGAGVATEARFRPSDKARARVVRNLDREIAELQKRIEAREK